MSLNLNSLRLFEAVARLGSFVRAADDALVSQPAISRAVRDLEDGLGVALFVRSGRGATLTDAGVVLADHARALFGIARTAEQEMRAFQQIGRGTLRVGASTTIATYLLPALLAKFAKKFPNIDVRLESANTLAVADRFCAYELDIALVEGPVHDPRLTVEVWREDELILVAPPAHAIAGKRIKWSRLVGERFLVREDGSGTASVVEQALADRGYAMQQTMELGSTEVIKQSVAAGLGVAFLSKAAVRDMLDSGALAKARVQTLDIRRTFTQLHLAGRRSSAAALAFQAVLAGR